MCQLAQSSLSVLSNPTTFEIGEGALIFEIGESVLIA